MREAVRTSELTMDLHVRSSAYGISVDRNAEVVLEVNSGVEHDPNGAEDCAISKNYWQLYKEKYHRLGITGKSTASDTASNMTLHDLPGAISRVTVVDNTIGSSCRNGKSTHQVSSSASKGSRCHRTYSERCSRSDTLQLLRPNSNPGSNTIVDCQDVKLDIPMPLISHSFSTSDFRNCQKSQPNQPRGSDLGFSTGDDTGKPLMTSTPRTSSLLNDPTLRKHLARAMGVDPSSDALEGEINRRVGSVHVVPTVTDTTSSCWPVTKGINNNDKDAHAGKPEVKSMVKIHGKNQENTGETKCKFVQDLTRESNNRINSNCAYGAEGVDMSRYLSEENRILLSCKRTKGDLAQGMHRTGASQVEGSGVKDVTYQSWAITSSGTHDLHHLSDNSVMSPSLEQANTNNSSIWPSTTKDTADGADTLDRHMNRTESIDKKTLTPSTLVLPVSPAIAKRPQLPRRTHSVNVHMTTPHLEVRAGFHMPSFREFKELKKQKSTSSDDAMSEDQCLASVNTKVPKHGSMEYSIGSSAAAFKAQENVKCTVSSEEMRVASDATQETQLHVRKPRHKKTSVKASVKSTCAQNSKHQMIHTQKTTLAACDEMQSPEAKSDTKSVCVVSPVSVHSNSDKVARGTQNQQTGVELDLTELNLPVAPPRPNRKLKVQLKQASDIGPETVCVDCINAKKTSTSNRRDETFRSSRCRLHQSKTSQVESGMNDWTLTEDGDESPLWNSLTVSTANEMLDSQTQNAVVRSVSDVSDLNAEEKRRKPVRRRRMKPYKSDPFDNSTKLEGDKISEQAALTHRQRCIDAEGLKVSSRNDIVEFLQQQTFVPSGSIRENDEVGELGQTAIRRRRHRVQRSLERSYSKKEEDYNGRRVKRTDSGVCCEADERSRGSKDMDPGCEDCGKVLEDTDVPEGLQWEEVFTCRKCKSRCVERKETIQEIVDTEISYGKDLRIIKGEFYEPMKTASLLNADQLQSIFSNLDELIEVNNRFADILQDALELANEQGDEDYTTVSIGELFLHSSTMLLAYETYCVNQSGVAPYLEQLESNKELLRVFLSVSQTENSVLRRMSFKSFLMVPVQRIMRYPLLLERVYKVTPVHHHDRDVIKKAEEKIEAILNHINRKSKSPMTNTLLRMSKRRFGGPPPGCRSISSSSAENIEVNKVTCDMLPWDRNEVNFVLTGRMLYCQQQEQLWGKKGRTLKLLPINCVLVTLGKGKPVTSPVTPTDDTTVVFNRPPNVPSNIQHAALVLVKEKWFKCTPLRDPIYLDKCVVSLDDEFRLIEVLDIASNESYAIKGENQEATVKWHEHLKLYSTTLGMWRHRRNALPNIMVQNLSKFHELAAADLYD